MTKKIKLKEKDLVKIVDKIISEQIGSGDNPLAAIKPPEKRETRRQIINKEPVVNGDILRKKAVAKTSLEKTIHYVNELIKASGINPETNNLVPDLEKVKEKFDNLFGEPSVENDEE